MSGKIGRLVTAREWSVGLRNAANRLRKARLDSWTREAGVQGITKTPAITRSKQRQDQGLPSANEAASRLSADEQGMAPRNGEATSLLLTMLALNKAEVSSRKTTRTASTPVTDALNILKTLGTVNQALSSPKSKTPSLGEGRPASSKKKNSRKISSQDSGQQKPGSGSPRHEPR